MGVIVETRCGKLEGFSRGEHQVFRGVPFAKPPVGALRFRAPEDPDSWAGTRAAIDYGASSMQSNRQLPGQTTDGPRSEDCLFLNVYTPAADDRQRPVMVWIHGGGFNLGSGSAPLYDGGALCERGDVVVVTLNYRLGPFGYLVLSEHGGDEFGATANAGQLDQIAALRWVRDNIAAFGGDPDNVTIFGESAGSLAVCSLMAMPEANGLFHRAIGQSGAMKSLFPISQATEVAEMLLKRLGVDGDVGKLWDLSAEQLSAAQDEAIEDAGVARAYFPVADGKTMPKNLYDAFSSGASADVPLLIGSNRDEVNFFTMPLLRKLDQPMEDSRVFSILEKELPSRGHHLIPPMVEAYRGSRVAHDLPSSNRALLGAIQTDFRFRMGSVLLAEAHRAHQPDTYMYLMTYESPAMDGLLRSCHAIDLALVFGTLDAPFQDRFVGTGAAVEAFSGNLMDSWIQFARTGNPTTSTLAPWDAYDEARRATMILDLESTLADAPFDEERAAWEGIL